MKLHTASMSAMTGILILMSTSFLASDPPAALSAEANYDESKIPPYELPELLKTAAGAKIETREAWEKTRRPEILELFREHVFGRAPGRPEGMTFEQVSKSEAQDRVRKVVRVKFGPEPDAPSMTLTIWMPRSGGGEPPKPAPLFVGMNLFDAAKTPLELGSPWEPPAAGTPSPQPRSDFEKVNGAEALHALRGNEIESEGCGFATLNPADFAPDDKEKWDQGVIAYFRKKTGAAKTDSDWGAIGAWAWALSRAMDYFETDPEIDAKKVIVIGHSRMGKTALWAGAQDPRFAAVISNMSGCGGAALSRRAVGETVKMINDRFPHWFCDKFKTYNDRENDIPVDQHMLIALTAPRPVYVASAEEDKWADPKGEFLAALAAEPAWRLYGLTGLGATEQPPVNRTIGDRVAYHIRTGKHALTALDWAFYVEFALRTVGGEGAGANTREIDALEAKALKTSNGRAWRVGPNLFIQTRDAGVKVFPDLALPLYGNTMAYPRLKASFVNPDMAYVLVSGYESTSRFLVDLISGAETPIDADPVFSPDRARFATGDHDEMGDVNPRVSIWSATGPAPVLEWRHEADDLRPQNVKWESPDRLTFENALPPGETGPVRRMTVVRSDGKWELQTAPAATKKGPPK